MNASTEKPLHRARELQIPLTAFLLIVDISSQTVSLFERSATSTSTSADGHFAFVSVFPCSTSRHGAGQVENSNRTPMGLHRIAEKIGDGCPAGTVFKARQPIGYTWEGMPDAKITTRIMWLDGLEPGFNQGGNVDSHARYIYIHGTADQPSIGTPTSSGCVHLTDEVLIPLFDRLPSGTLVWIQ